MIIGSGIDVIPNQLLEEECAHAPWDVADGIFTARELRSCATAKRPPLRLAQYFAAKEAACKALGNSIPDLALFREVEVVERAGSWSLQLHGRLAAQATALGVGRSHLAIASTRQHTTALVLLES